MNFGVVALIVVVVWSVLSIVVSVAVGGMAQARDAARPQAYGSQPAIARRRDLAS